MTSRMHALFGNGILLVALANGLGVDAVQADHVEQVTASDMVEARIRFLPDEAPAQDDVAIVEQIFLCFHKHDGAKIRFEIPSM